MNRRDFLKRTCALASLAAASAAGSARAMAANPMKKVMVLGIDGMDPKLLQRFVDEGVMPNFKRFIAEGDFRPLRTSMPPQSPVAWSTFTTGMDPGGHGIFDFVHRDPKTLQPCLSTSEALPPDHSLRIGTWDLPLSGGEVNLLRQGKAFWQLLEEAGVPTTVFRMPANFPPAESPGYSLSGMGTPDMLGTSGTFQYFTNVPPPDWKHISGGVVTRVRPTNDVVKAAIKGPPNSFRRMPKEPATGAETVEYEIPDVEVDFTAYLDRQNKTAMLAVQDTEIVLRQGEWSDWFRIDFDMIPHMVGGQRDRPVLP